MLQRPTIRQMRAPFGLAVHAEQGESWCHTAPVHTRAMCLLRFARNPGVRATRVVGYVVDDTKVPTDAAYVLNAHLERIFEIGERMKGENESL